MSNSKLVSYTKISPRRTSPRNDKIRKITVHHMAGNLSVETCGNVFQTRQASANYGIGSDGRVGQYVDEADRAWSTAWPDNDNQAINIEVANDGGAPDWHVSDEALASLVDLCVDICRRNGIDKLTYTGDATGNLTRHNMFVPTACPGPYLQSKFPWIAQQVNARLGVAEDKPTAPAPAPAQEIIKGSTVRLNPGAKDYSGKGLASFVYTRDHIVSEVAGDRCVITYDGVVVAAVRKSDLTLVSGGAPSQPTAPAPAQKIIKGSAVRIKQGAKTYEGGGLASFVYDRDHVVSEVSGDRCVITYNGVVVAAVRKSDLTLVSGGASTPKPTTSAFTPYTVKVSVTELRIRSGPGTDTQSQGFIEPGVYTIVEEADGPGAKRWGKLKSGAGWISLDYAAKC